MKKYFIILPVIALAVTITIIACKKDTINTTPPAPQQTVIPIPNGDFESWQYGVYCYLPTGWTYNSCCASLCPPAGVPDSMAYHGHLALKLVNADSVYYAQTSTKFPLISHPSTFIGYVKCNLATNDTVAISIKLFKNRVAVDSGKWIGTSSISSYTQINIPISQHVAVIDTAMITIRGGTHLTSHQLNNGTTFWVDYLSFIQ